MFLKDELHWVAFLVMKPLIWFRVINGAFQIHQWFWPTLELKPSRYPQSLDFVLKILKKNEKQGPYGQRCFLMVTKWLHECVTTWLLTDRWTIRPSYRDAKMNLEGLVFLLWQYYTQKWWYSLFLTKAWPTDQRTDRPTNGRTDPVMEMQGRI